MGYGRLAFAMLVASGCSAPQPPEAPVRAADVSGAVTPAAGASAPTDPIAALAALPTARLERSDPAVGRFLDKYFPDACEADDRLSFDTVCQYYATTPGDDPSPWPELLVGLDGGKLASALPVGRETNLPGWICKDLPLPNPTRACFAPHTTPEDRALWTQQWTAFLSAAD